MAAFLDGCRFNPTAGGTADWTYSTAVPGYQSPAAANVVSGRLYKYRAESGDLSQWELGEGAYNTGTGVLARSTVLFNSSGTTSKISFASAPQVAIVALKEDLISIEEANSFSAAQQAQARSNINATPFDALAFSGMQINGSMDVSQESGATQLTLTSSASKYVVDGFIGLYIHGANTAVFKAQQVAPPGAPSFGLAFPNCLQLTGTTALTAPAAGDFALVYQNIEGLRVARLGFGNGNAQPVTIGFWVYASVAGTASVAIRNAAANRSYVANVTVNNAATWGYKTVVVPGDQAGTWGATNGIGLTLLFCFASGSTFQTAANTWAASNSFATPANTNFFASNNNVVCVTGVVVLPGTEAPSAARSSFIMRPADQELNLCQRHLQVFNQSYYPAMGLTNGVVVPFYSDVPFRAAPTLIHSLTDAGFTTAGTPGATQWNVQSFGIASVTKTGTCSFPTSTSTLLSFLCINGMTFSIPTNALSVGSSINTIKLDARL